MPKQAALYARVSSEQQSESGTIQSQIAALLDRCQSDEMTIPEELRFIDDGYSGATLVRPALERLRDAVYNGAVDSVYMQSPDRLSRKYAYQILLIDEFRRAGVEVVFLNRKLADTPEDELLLQVQGIVAEYERAKIMERSRRGRIYAARQGSLNVFGRAPYGYRYVRREEADGNAHFEIAFDEARVVQQIFQWIGKERITLNEASRRLTAAGVKTSSGKTGWSASTISGMLKNPAYMGHAAFGKTTVGAPRTRYRRPKGAPEHSKRGHSVYDVPSDQWISIPVPPLVTPALFEVVQQQLAENQKRARERKRGASYLLQGLLTCKQCGHAFTGQRQLSRNGTKSVQYTYYSCVGTSSHACGGTRICNNKLVRCDLLDDAVWSQVLQLLKEPAALEKEYKRRLSSDKSMDPTQLHREQAKIRNSIARMIDSYADGTINKQEFEPRVKRARAKLNQIESQMKTVVDAEEQKQQLRLLIIQFDEFRSRISTKLAAGLDWETRRQIVRALVKVVEIDEKSVDVTFRIGQIGVPQNKAG
jgi:site-specific DNA recombinase